MALIRAMIVDDEPLARRRLAALLAESGYAVEVIGEAGGGDEAIPLIHDLRPDVLFLDIQMPVLNGFDVVELLPVPRPHIVFVTAYDQHALRAFEVHALDYLTKPVRLARLNDTLARIVSLGASHAEQRATESEAIGALLAERPRAPLTRLTLRNGRRLHIANVAEIRWLESRDKLVIAHLAGASGGAYTTDFTLDELEARLDPACFLRLHRSCIASTAHMRELLPWLAGTYAVTLDDGTQLPVARRRVRAVRERVKGK